jgi:hypothetical protein
LKFLFEQLKNPTKMVLLFKASEHNFSPFEFHAHCDDIAHTIVIVQTEHGKTIGGYTPLMWNGSTKGRRYAYDFDKKSFLFSLDSLTKVPLGESGRAIRCDGRDGPAFGSGHDLGISPYCDRQKYSCVKFKSYDISKAGYANEEEAVTDFCGAKDNNNFKVLEYEVYKVIWY